MWKKTSSILVFQTEEIYYKSSNFRIIAILWQRPQVTLGVTYYE